MPSIGDNGVVLLAHGRDEYFQQAICLAWTIKAHSPGVRVALACDRSSLPEAAAHLFDECIPFDFSEWPGVSAKVNLDLITPFADMTLFLDSDAFVYGDLSPLFEKYADRSFTALGKNIESVGHWFKDCNAVKAYFNAKLVPFFIGDFYLFRRDQTSVFSVARDMLALYDTLGCNRARGGAMSDERLIALAMMEQGLAVAPRSDDEIVCLVSQDIRKCSSNVLCGERLVTRGAAVSHPKIIHFADYSRYPLYGAESCRIRLAMRGWKAGSPVTSLLGGAGGALASFGTRACGRAHRFFSKLKLHALQVFTYGLPLGNLTLLGHLCAYPC